MKKITAKHLADAKAEREANGEDDGDMEGVDIIDPDAPQDLKGLFAKCVG